jgi:hypothetical protein
MQTGKILGGRVYVQDDGGIVTEPLALRVPEVAAEIVVRAEQAEARERAAVAEAAVLLRIAQGFDDDDRDYERINNLHGCENNHWRTQLREFVAGNSAATALLKELDGLRAKASAAQAAAEVSNG